MKFKFNQKADALGAAAPVLLSGATPMSRAAWTDTEWINGGVGTLPGLGASTFDVQRNVTTDSTSWASREVSVGDHGHRASTPRSAPLRYGRPGGVLRDRVRILGADWSDHDLDIRKHNFIL